MRIFLILSLFSFEVYSQALPLPVENRMRLAIGETIKAQILLNTPAANDSQIQKTLQKVGVQLSEVANNPSYVSTSTRWLTTSIRIITRFSPYIFIALEACDYLGYCSADPKLQITQFVAPDKIYTPYNFDLPAPLPISGFIEISGKLVPLADFSCRGFNNFFVDLNYHIVTDGPCKVQLGNVPEILNIKSLWTDYYISVSEPDNSAYDVSFLYSNNKKTLAQLTITPSVICHKISNLSGTGTLITQEKNQNPFWPCITKNFFDKQPSLASSGVTASQPYYWNGWAQDINGVRQPFVTDFPISTISTYPAAPPQGEQSIPDWISSLNPAQLAQPLSPDLITQIANRAWQDAEATPGFDGEPYIEILPEVAEDVMTGPLSTDWPTIQELITPSPFTNWAPATKPSTVTTTYQFNWSCGFLTFPKCLVEFLVNPSPSNIDQISTPSPTVFDPISVNPFTSPYNFSQYINARLIGYGCSPYPVTANILGKQRSFTWDFCKFANVSRDVLAFLAYMFTVGFFISALTTSRQNRK